MADSVSTLIENQQLFAQSLAASARSALDSLRGLHPDPNVHLGPPGEVGVAVPDGLVIQGIPELNQLVADLSLLGVPSFVGGDFKTNLSLTEIPDSGTSFDVDTGLTAIPAFTATPFTPAEPSPELPLQAVPAPVLPPTLLNTTGPRPPYAAPSRPGPVAGFNGTVPTGDSIRDIPDLDVDQLLSGIPPLTLDPIVIPPAPTITIPEFNARKPGAAPSAPTNLASALSSGYASGLNIGYGTTLSSAQSLFRTIAPNYGASLAILETRLQTYLSGGTGVDTGVATAIYEVERGQRNAEYRRVGRAAVLDAGKRGFELPDGTQRAAEMNARIATADANALSSAKLRKDLFDLEQKNVQFAVEQMRQWQSTAIQTFQGLFATLGTLNGQAVDYAKATLQAVVDTYNAAIAGYRASMEGYQVEAQVFGEKIKVALANADLYRARLEGERAKASVNEARVRILEGRLRVIDAAVGAYKGRVEAIVAKASLIKLKFDVYEAQARSYASLVGAKEAEYRGFAAEVSGQTEQQRAWGEQVRAHTAELEGWRAEVSAISEQTKAMVAYNQGVAQTNEARSRIFTERVRAGQYITQADYEKYRAQVEAIAKSNEQKAASVRIALEAKSAGYRARVEAIGRNNDNLSANARLALEQAGTSYRAYVESIGRANEAKSAIAKLQLDENSANQRLELESIVRSNESAAAIARMKLEEWVTGRQIVLKKSEQEIVRAQLEANLQVANIGKQIEIARGVAETASRLAQAALSGVNSILASVNNASA